MIAEKDGVEDSEADGTNRPITVWTYDNLNEVTQTQTFDGDGVTLNAATIAFLQLGEPAFAPFTTGNNIVITSVTVGSSGNVFLAGTLTGPATFGSGGGAVELDSDYSSDGSEFMAEYSAGGAFDWVEPTTGTINNLAADGSGNIYAVGDYSGDASFGSQRRTSRPPPQATVSFGNCPVREEPICCSPWALTADSSATAVNVAVDSSNSAYIVGQFSGAAPFNGAGGFGTSSGTGTGYVDIEAGGSGYSGLRLEGGQFLHERLGGAGGRQRQRSDRDWRGGWFIRFALRDGLF